MKLQTPVKKLKNFKIIILDHNNLKPVVNSFFAKLAKLNKLEFSCNFELYVIPETILNCTNLTTFNAYMCQIKEIPTSLFTNCINLKEIDLHRNTISKIPKTICNLTSLLDLNLCNNLIKKISDSISRCTNLQVLNPNNS